LLALTIAFYVFVYTIWLKRRTPQNIVIGGAAARCRADWLGRGHGRCRLGRGRAVRDRLFLDTAAFLGVVALSRR